MNGLYSLFSSVAKRVFREVTAGNTEIQAEIPACTSTSSVRWCGQLIKSFVRERLGVRTTYCLQRHHVMIPAHKLLTIAGGGPNLPLQYPGTWTLSSSMTVWVKTWEVASQF